MRYKEINCQLNTEEDPHSRMATLTKRIGALPYLNPQWLWITTDRLIRERMNLYVQIQDDAEEFEAGKQTRVEEL